MATAQAEEAEKEHSKDAKDAKDKTSAEEAHEDTEKVDSDISFVVNFLIPQLVVNTDDDIEFEMKVDAHEDIVEAVETNFVGALDELKIEETDYVRYSKVSKSVD